MRLTPLVAISVLFAGVRAFFSPEELLTPATAPHLDWRAPSTSSRPGTLQQGFIKLRNVVRPLILPGQGKDTYNRIETPWLLAEEKKRLAVLRRAGASHAEIHNFYAQAARNRQAEAKWDYDHSAPESERAEDIKEWKEHRDEYMYRLEHARRLEKEHLDKAATATRWGLGPSGESGRG